MKHIVFFSGGAGSYGAAKRVAEQHGTEDLILFFTDTLMEDEDLYRFLDEAAADVGGQLVKIAEGHTPWQIFFKERFLGNSRIDPCSKLLKRQLARKWITENFKPDECILYMGIDWTEEHRYVRSKRYWEPYQVEAPLCQKPFLMKAQILQQMSEAGIKPPRLYEMGFPHNNCGGFCIKAGQAQFKLLLEKFPERYQFHEEQEKKLREHLGKDVSVMRRVRNKVKENLTMEQLRLEVEAKQQIDDLDWGGCGCFMDDGADEEKPTCNL